MPRREISREVAASRRIHFRALPAVGRNSKDRNSKDSFMEDSSQPLAGLFIFGAPRHVPGAVIAYWDTEVPI